MEGHPQSNDPAHVETGLQEITSEIGVFQHLEDLAGRCGFACFALISLPVSRQESLSDNLIASNWQAEFVDAYEATLPFRDAPLFIRLRATTAPVQWTLDDCGSRPTVGSRQGRRLFTAHGFLAGVALPVGSSEGARAVVLMAGNRTPLPRDELAELMLDVIYAHDRYCQLRHEPEAATPRLSERELQVLGWAANGKTSVEIATILTLSDHTVNSYLNSAMRKLDCVNRTQLVAKALRLRLIN